MLFLYLCRTSACRCRILGDPIIWVFHQYFEEKNSALALPTSSCSNVFVFQSYVLGFSEIFCPYLKRSFPFPSPMLKVTKKYEIQHCISNVCDQKRVWKTSDFFCVNYIRIDFKWNRFESANYVGSFVKLRSYC